ncbi:hypothetical protein NMY22_g9365 [Coprinellus aureogranulatus]|nr:hypothetical protein NMY22_g9365 [Coprinellus aureogranulatus]
MTDRVPSQRPYDLQPPRRGQFWQRYLPGLVGPSLRIGVDSFDILERAGLGSSPPSAPDGGIDAEHTTSNLGSLRCRSGQVLGSELPPCFAIPPRTIPQSSSHATTSTTVSRPQYARFIEPRRERPRKVPNSKLRNGSTDDSRRWVIVLTLRRGNE